MKYRVVKTVYKNREQIRSGKEGTPIELGLTETMAKNLANAGFIEVAEKEKKRGYTRTSGSGQESDD